MKQLLSSLVLFVSAVLAGAANGTKPYRYEPNVVTLHGTLHSRVFAGPPEYSSIKRGDRPQHAWFIKLPRPISIEGDKDPDSINESEAKIEEVQVILESSRDSEILKKQMGKLLTVTGTLFHAHTIHHHFTVLMDVKKYEVGK